ncbi:MAG: hypothetical protein IJ011_09665 [Clostridia bacterium]|nr:hypothetical protein [Clostridia bacterium]
MKIYTSPISSILYFAKEDILTLSENDPDDTFIGVADGGKGTGTEIDFDKLT